ncbi:unnamed protein product [Paramecium sonneborni]|uniref:Uncharacterized protein n=1 Tax=Paramecium sonneborni TaxID=65129 RepID=A0A8S1N0Y2_9CILI|nr:unnamed protein product [Paramecium sonneborni]
MLHQMNQLNENQKKCWIFQKKFNLKSSIIIKKKSIKKKFQKTTYSLLRMLFLTTSIDYINQRFSLPEQFTKIIAYKEIQDYNILQMIYYVEIKEVINVKDQSFIKDYISNQTQRFTSFEIEKLQLLCKINEALFVKIKQLN